jgi:dTDP-4-amino-4,6-dideoxygalactose transaminase
MKFVNSLSPSGRQEKVLSALRGIAISGQYADGANIFMLEKKFASMMNGRFSISFNSCGSALYTLFRYYYSLGHRYVAIQNNTFHATGAMAIEAGLKVFLVDSSPICPSMGVDALKIVLDGNSKVRLVVMTHVGGWMAKDYESIATLCNERNVVLVEDCAHAIGINTHGAYPGMLSDAACWSFYQSGILASGEGGMITTWEPELRAFAKAFHSYGRHVNNGISTYGIGMNLRMSEWDAAVTCVLLDELPAILAARKRDHEVLQSIAPCLLLGDNNGYRYPVDPEYAERKQKVPSIYTTHDQLATTLPKHSVSLNNISNSVAWASNHCCLPIGEGIYDGMSTEEVQKFLVK